MAEGVSNSDRAASREVLKAGHARSVWVEREPDGSARVVKRFRSKGPVARLADGRRARREYDNLRWLRERGLPVPEAYGIEKRDGGWEVSMQLVQGAASLDQLPGTPTPRGIRARMRALGRLLAALHQLGVHHPDLHVGNVLIDERDAPWLIDFHSARHGLELSRESLASELAQLAGGARTQSWSLERAFFLRAWHAALSERLRRIVGPREALALEVEQRARVRARELVDAQLGRWTRKSSRIQLVDDELGHLMCSRSLTPRLVRKHLVRLQTRAGSRIVAPDGKTVLLRGDRRELTRVWVRCGRMQELDLPAPRPWACRLEKGGFVLLNTWPPDDSPCTDPHTLLSLLGRLHDRGLDVRGPLRDAVWNSARRGSLSPHAELVPYDPRPGQSLERRLASVADELPALPLDPACAAAYADAFRAYAHAAEHRAIEAELLGR